jgi:hypothetical protein
MPCAPPPWPLLVRAARPRQVGSVEELSIERPSKRGWPAQPTRQKVRGPLVERHMRARGSKARLRTVYRDSAIKTRGHPRTVVCGSTDGASYRSCERPPMASPEDQERARTREARGEFWGWVGSGATKRICASFPHRAGSPALRSCSRSHSSSRGQSILCCRRQPEVPTVSATRRIGK